MIRSCWSRTRCYEFCLCYAASFIVQVFSIRPSLFCFFFFFVFFSLNLFFSLAHSRLNSNKAERLEFHLCIPYFNRACYVSYAHQHTLTRSYIRSIRHMRKWYANENCMAIVYGGFAFVVTTVVVYCVYTDFVRMVWLRKCMCMRRG